MNHGYVRMGRILHVVEKKRGSQWNDFLVNDFESVESQAAGMHGDDLRLFFRVLNGGGIRIDPAGAGRLLSLLETEGAGDGSGTFRKVTFSRGCDS